LNLLNFHIFLIDGILSRVYYPRGSDFFEGISHS
jgi:hypothetical protein